MEIKNNRMSQQECIEKYDVLIKLLKQIQHEQTYFHEAMENLEKIPTGVRGDIA